MDGQEPSFRCFALKDGREFECYFCAYKFVEGTSISRIKWHLAGVDEEVTKVCERVPAYIKEAARQTIPLKNKRRKTMRSLSNNELNNTVSTSIREQGNGAENRETVVEITQMQVTGREGELWQGRASSHAEAGNHIKKSIIREPLQPAETVRFPEGPVLDAQEISGDALLTTKLVGKVCERYMNQIRSWLMEEDVLSIGIYGMGGVGKTALAKHIHNQLLEDHSLFGQVYWVTVTPDFSIQKLQNSIANCVQLDLSNEDDENKRVAKLWKTLIRKNKCVLILDDMWNYIPLDRVGIPINKKGFKLVLTTRSLDMCRMTCCQKNVKVEPLLFEEGWDLFMEELGQETKFSFEIKKIARSMVREYAGLPLVIECMARRMAGMVDICEWRNALEEIRGSIPRQYNKEVYQRLKLSFDHLDSELQQCFFCCALFPKNYAISRQELINYLIDEGIIKKMSSRQAEFDKGHGMLNALENICLLQSVAEEDVTDSDLEEVPDKEGRYVKMHGFMRHMALQMLRAKSQSMVEAGEKLEKLPDKKKWTEDLVRISLVRNDVTEIPSSYSPSCPNLSTLLLCGNKDLALIANSFFNQLHGLKVLDLSRTAIEELPHSVSDLASLTALLLSHCWRLRRLPSLTKLKLLERLDLTFSGLEEVPKGMELMANLTYLDLLGTSIKEIRAGILSNLFDLQLLRLGMPLQTSVIREIASLRKLEVLECRFSSICDLFEYLEHNKKTLIKYNFAIQPTLDSVVWFRKHHFDYDCCIGSFNKKIALENCDVSRGDCQRLPEDIDSLDILGCHNARSLCYASLLKFATELKALSIAVCDGMGCLLSLPLFSLSLPLFESLEILNLCYLKNLRVLFDREGGGPLILPPIAIFPSLRIFEMSSCSSIKKLFPSSLLPNLQNLEEIAVRGSLLLEEIIESEGQEGASGEFSLPKLRLLKLEQLPELKSICSRVMICNSIRQIHAINCPRLGNIPIFLPLPSLERIVVRPREWWDTVVWGDSPDAKNTLQCFCICPSESDDLGTF